MCSRYRTSTVEQSVLAVDTAPAKQKVLVQQTVPAVHGQEKILEMVPLLSACATRISAIAAITSSGHLGWLIGSSVGPQPGVGLPNGGSEYIPEVRKSVFRLLCIDFNF